MKAKPLFDWKYKALSLASLLCTIYVFWVINADHSTGLLPTGRRDGLDLLMIALVTLLAKGTVFLIDRTGRGSLALKLSQSLFLFTAAAGLSVWLFQQFLIDPAVWQFHLLPLRFPLALVLFTVWAASYLQWSRVRRIESQLQGLSY